MSAPLLVLIGAALRLRRNAHLARSQFEAERLRRFRDFARFVQAKSPYYRQIMQAQGINAATSQPSDFPVLTKHLLRENFDRIVTDDRIRREAVAEFLQRSRQPQELYRERFIVLHSSGSSGEVGHFVFSRSDWMRGFAALTRLYQPGMRRTRCAFYGATSGHFGGVSWAFTPSQGVGRYVFDARGFDINAPFGQTLQQLDDFQPHILAGYATGNKILAQAQMQGRLRICPETVLCGAECLSKADQQWVGQAFGCPCINIYGASETMLMGIARPGDPGMTLFDDLLIFEPASDHVLVTNLFNRTMPLIRYRLSDCLRFTDHTSPYGHYPVIEPLVGREGWVPWFRNALGQSEFLSASAIEQASVPGVWRFQFRCKDETSFRIAVCLDSGLDASQQARTVAAVRERVREVLNKKGLSNVAFDVDVVEDIAVNPVTRKFQTVLPPPLASG